MPSRTRKGGGALLPLTLALALLPGVAGAAGPLQNRLDDMSDRVAGLEQTTDELALDFGKRRGLIGSLEARERFEEAVYLFLIGEYDDAALSFYILVDAQALDSAPLHQDSEWYLAECLFNLGNLATAAEAYQRVIDEGEVHPFFPDAVRRLLEVYGLQRDQARFDQVYKEFIVTGRVQATDFVKYTVGKSFWRQGQATRAKGMFADVAADSSVYMRARYFLGAVLVEEGDLDAAKVEFQRVVDAQSPAHESDATVRELSWMALGRIAYETGDYNAASAAYSHINNESDQFADQLYEQVWTYVRQEDWASALAHLDIFLLGFPAHREAVNLRLTQAQVYMKEAEAEEIPGLREVNRDKALEAYQKVVEEYEPVVQTLARLKTDEAGPAAYFRLLAEAEGDPEIEQPLPDYAVEILTDDEYMGRAVDVYRGMASQEADLQRSEELAEQVSAALSRADRNIGTFARGRARVRGVREDALNMQAALVQFEIDYLLARGSSADRAGLESLQSRYQVLQGREVEVAEEQTTDTGRRQAQADQIDAVQQVASRVLEAARDEQARLRGVRAGLDGNETGLSDGTRAEVRSQLARTAGELSRVQKGLERIVSPSTRTSILAAVEGKSSDPLAAQRRMMGRDYGALRDDVRRYRSGAAGSDDRKVFDALDDLWSRADALDDRAASVLARLDSAERSELGVLRRRLGEENDRVEGARRDLVEVQTEAEEIATEIAQVGFSTLEADIEDTVMEADLGIVDVSWLDKTESSDEIERLSKERAKSMQEMEDRFRIIEQKLEGTSRKGGQ
ncbi:MAG: tetratricopeptide repeat protein [Alphaproteobacteria bacterium]|nr:tetratricopeptide repeat protein [Alphaproteobacteria bacterium]